MKTCDPVRTLMEIKHKLDHDKNRTPVDATKYRRMIDALMYLTSSKPDIVHATCLCARYQAKPTEKHLKEVKRIFHYLRGTVNMGLWYTKDSSFELTRFSYADYAGCKDTFKSTFDGTQFLGEKLVGWSSRNPLDEDTVNGLWLSFQQDSYQNQRDLPRDTPLDRVEVLRTFRVILSSIHNDEWKSFQSQPQTACGSHAGNPEHFYWLMGRGIKSRVKIIWNEAVNDWMDEIEAQNAPQGPRSFVTSLYKDGLFTQLKDV
ncbi:hypothetical protein Tco_0684722 [Tanacetum coccineum]